ncbi:hypothetical protein BDV10DRAFT_189401 [Aspergillus recurvatus]
MSGWNSKRIIWPVILKISLVYLLQSGVFTLVINKVWIRLGLAPLAFLVNDVQERKIILSFKSRPQNQHQNPDLKKGPYLVAFHPADTVLSSPQFWPLLKKLKSTLIARAVIFLALFVSSEFGPAAAATASEFYVDPVVMNLFVSRFAVVPLFSALLSQIIENTASLLISLIGCAIYQIPQCLASDPGSGVLAEVWLIHTRAIAFDASATSMNLESSVGAKLDRYWWQWIG